MPKSKEEAVKIVSDGLNALWDKGCEEFILLGFKNLTTEEVHEISKYFAYMTDVFVLQKGKTIKIGEVK